MLKKLALFGAAALSLVLVGCEQETAGSSSDEVIRIAVSAPMTGNDAEFGHIFYNAAVLQAENWNANGGVLGKQVEIVQYDDRNEPGESALIAERLVSSGDYLAVLGPFASGPAFTSAPILNENEIIKITPTASHPDLTALGEFVFRNNTTIDIEGAAMVDIAREEFEGRNIGIVSIMTEWGQTASGLIADTVQSFDDLNLVAHEEVMEGSTDFSPTITVLEAAGVETIIFVAHYGTIGPFARQYRAINPEINFVSLSSAYSQFLLDLGGEAVEGLKFPSIFYAGDTAPDVVDFVERFTERTGNVPSSFAAQAYDAIAMLLTAVELAETTESRPVRDVLIGLKYTGVTGELEYDDLGNIVLDFNRIVIRDGEFVRVGE